MANSKTVNSDKLSLEKSIVGSCASFEIGYFYLKDDTQQDVLMSYALY